MDFLNAVAEFIKFYGSTIALLITWLTLVYVYMGKRSNWLRKQFLDQVNFSLNHVSDNQLLMRTLIETHANNVWLNDLGVKQVVNAAAKTTLEQPFVSLDDEEDMNFINRAVLNVLSEKFASGFLASAMGLPIKSATYRFAITMERYDDIRTLKLRVLIVDEKELETLFTTGSEEGAKIHLRTPLYEARLKTLRMMADLHRRQNEQGVMKLGRVVLSVPV